MPAMPIELAGKPIAITGASAGIGRATALACARAGMPVVVSARREEPLRELVAQIEREGGKAAHLVVDVNDPEACERMIALCAEQFGSVYSVFANAGYGQEALEHEMPDAELRAMFETNFFGTMHTIRPALERMIPAGAGHVLICSSCLARFPLPYFGVYSATKAAQHHIGRSLRLEIEPTGVKVSTVHPVGTKTEFFDVAQRRSWDGAQSLSDHGPSWMLQSPERVANAVLRGLRRPKPEIWTSPFVRYGMVFAGAFPRLADLGVRKMVREHEAKRSGVAKTRS
ncbi:MAG: SDR family NAD(P)-dependent oxidoreductase [Phycisphaerales bacterium]|nr:MAG: SDR family NAD(P)-dependent oxidoreductase [Phycisphaerales bacterium]